MIHQPACPDLITHSRRAIDEGYACGMGLVPFVIAAERDFEAEQGTEAAVIAEAVARASAFWEAVGGEPAWASDQPETCIADGHIPGCPGRAGGDHEAVSA